MITTRKDWIIEGSEDRWNARQFYEAFGGKRMTGIYISGVKSLDDMLRIIDQRPTLDGLLSGINDKLKGYDDRLERQRNHPSPRADALLLV